MMTLYGICVAAERGVGTAAISQTEFLWETLVLEVEVGGCPKPSLLRLYSLRGQINTGHLAKGHHILKLVKRKLLCQKDILAFQWRVRHQSLGHVITTVSLRLA